MKLWAHTLVKNEERFLWFAVESVIDQVDKLLLWDTGSTDKTIDIIKLLKKKHSDKIDVALWGDVTASSYTVLRQKMLEKTKADWFIIVDGDEVWWQAGIQSLVGLININRNSLDSIVNGYYTLVGDIFHYLDDSHGLYNIDGVVGNITIRAMNRNIPGLFTAKPHGQHGYFDNSNVLVQDRNSKRRFHLKEKTYLHFTHLTRSASVSMDKLVPKRAGKLKYDFGKAFPLDFYYPEVFFRPYPAVISLPWQVMSQAYKVRMYVETPLRRLKRKLVKAKVGY